MSTRITPIRKVKDGAKGSYYEAKTSCGTIKILIVNGDDDYPVRVTVQPTGGGCQASLESQQRLVTLLLEMNARADVIIEQLCKVICPSCKSQVVKGNKEVAYSCASAIGFALKKHLGGEDEKKE